MGWVSFREDTLDWRERNAEVEDSIRTISSKTDSPSTRQTAQSRADESVALVATTKIKGELVAARLLRRPDGTFVCWDHGTVFPVTDADVQRHIRRWHYRQSRCCFCKVPVPIKELRSHVDAEHAAERHLNLRTAVRSKSEKLPKPKRNKRAYRRT